MPSSKTRQLRYCFLAAACLLVLLGYSAAAHAAVTPAVNTSNPNLVTRVAPGDSLPISVTLTNFGNGQSTDVTINFQILNPAGMSVLSSTETVAVATTASYTKIIQIPSDFAPGTYTADSSITYEGQLVPATSSYQFTVERKIFGIFQSDFIAYAVATLFIALLCGFVTWLLVKKNRTSRFEPYDYPGIPAPERMYYEIVSDVIMQMRYRVGDKAMEIARSVDGLQVDEDTGRIVKIKENPTQIIAALISQYEKLLGKKVSLAFQSQGEQPKDTKSKINDNLLVVRKRGVQN